MTLEVNGRAMRLEGKVAVVTGAGSGIGEAIAMRFAEEGATVVCAGLHLARVEDTAEQIRNVGGIGLAMPLDVSSEDAVAAVLDEVQRRYGSLDVLVNNAGIGDVWERTIAVNLSGVYYGTNHAARRMAEQGSGSIINVASILGLVAATPLADLPELDASPYVASKHGVIGLTKAFAISYARRGVRVNCICPGYIETPMIAPLLENPAIRQALEKLHPIGRLGRPEEVAAAALFLASDESSFVTGSALVVDGGYTAQ
jgi:NAD(P)-dependent dehydrogenase (short-subunit alcohol dehydrogenase family)